MVRNRLVGCLAAVLAVGGVCADDIVLTEDTTVDVPSGETRIYQRLSGGYTLTKTGGGKLCVRRVVDATTKVVVQGGEFRVANELPSALSDAVIHLDAAAESTLTTETVGGTNFVTRWADANGGTYQATNTAEVREWRPNPENRRAFLSYDQTEVGLPMVDMGTPMVKGVTNELGETIGYGAAMTINFPKERLCREFFTVTSDNEEWKKAYLSGETGTSFLSAGSYGYMDGRRGAGATGKLPVLFYVHGSNAESKYCYYGTNTIDGALVESSSRFPDGVHVLNCVPTTKIYATALGRSYRSTGATCDTFGGIRYGEVLVFTNMLSGVDRTNVTDYLVTKWRKQTLASVTVDGGRFAVDEGLALDVQEYVVKDGPSVFVPAGASASFDTFDALDIYAHFDASDADSLVTETRGGTNFVTRWKSLNDPDGLYATNYWGAVYGGARPAFRPDPENRLPYVAADMSPTGRRAVDFGSYLTSNDKDGSEGYGAAFIWNTGLSSGNAAEFFTVAADNTDRVAKTRPAGAGSYFGSVANNGEGTRGEDGKLFSNSSTANINYTSTKAKLIYLDGDLGETTNDYKRVPAAGFHVVNNVPFTKINASAFAHNHRYTKNGTTVNAYGGLKIGEFLALKTAIDDGMVRTNVNAYLMNKWLGTPRAVRAYGTVEVPTGASFGVVREDVSVANLSVGGTVTALVFTNVTTLAATGAAGEIVGPLVLADGATLDFAQRTDGTWTALKTGAVAVEGAVTIRIDLADPKAARGQSVRLIAATDLPAALGSATVVCPKALAAVKLEVRTDGLYATFVRPGLLFYVR